MLARSSRLPLPKRKFPRASSVTMAQCNLSIASCRTRTELRGFLSETSGMATSYGYAVSSDTERDTPVQSPGGELFAMVALSREAERLWSARRGVHVEGSPRRCRVGPSPRATQRVPGGSIQLKADCDLQTPAEFVMYSRDDNGFNILTSKQSRTRFSSA